MPSGSALRHSILGSARTDTNGPKDLMVPDTYSLMRLAKDRETRDRGQGEKEATLKG